MFDVPPDPIAFQLGPISVGWYGLGYAIGLAVAYVVLVRLARAAGEDPDLVGNGIIIVSIAALIGGRAVPRHRPVGALRERADHRDPADRVRRRRGARLRVSPGWACTAASSPGRWRPWWYARRHHVSFARWADITAPALFDAGHRSLGELLQPGAVRPADDFAVGIPIDCAHRLSIYACATYPEATTRFHPLFLYESISGLLGAAFLVFLGYRLRSWLRPGDLLLVFFIWYGTTRFVLENPCVPTTGPSSGSRRRRSCQWPSSPSAWSA